MVKLVLKYSNDVKIKFRGQGSESISVLFVQEKTLVTKITPLIEKSVPNKYINIMKVKHPLEMIHFNGDIFENCVPQLLLPDCL